MICVHVTKRRIECCCCLYYWLAVLVLSIWRQIKQRRQQKMGNYHNFSMDILKMNLFAPLHPSLSTATCSCLAYSFDYFVPFFCWRKFNISRDNKQQQMNMLIKVINDQNLCDMRFHVSMRLFFYLLLYATLRDSTLLFQFIHSLCV